MGNDDENADRAIGECGLRMENVNLKKTTLLQPPALGTHKILAWSVMFKDVISTLALYLPYVRHKTNSDAKWKSNDHQCGQCCSRLRKIKGDETTTRIMLSLINPTHLSAIFELV